MELTKEHFETHLNKELKAVEGRIIKRIDESQEELARMVAAGFEDVQTRLDVREQVINMEKTFGLKFQKLEEALHIKL